MLTVAPVGFYAGLNLIAWFMVFCFVRETKQLTLEELDRKSHWLRCYPHLLSNEFRRGLLGSNIEIHLARVDRVASVVPQALRPPKEHSPATTHSREGGEGREDSRVGYCRDSAGVGQLDAL